MVLELQTLNADVMLNDDIKSRSCVVFFQKYMRNAAHLGIHTQTLNTNPPVVHDNTMRKLIATTAVLCTSSTVAPDIRTVWKGRSKGAVLF